LCVAPLRPVEENNQFIDDGRSIRTWLDIKRRLPLGLATPIAAPGPVTTPEAAARRSLLRWWFGLRAA
jgi:hypothetical protein